MPVAGDGPAAAAHGKLLEALGDFDDHLLEELLDGVEWDADTTGEIAKLLAENGYRIRSSDDPNLPPPPAIDPQALAPESKPKAVKKKK